MPGPVHVRGDVWIPERELTWRFTRSGGPGGQSVNTADSRVQLSFDVAASRSLTDALRARAVRRLGDRLANGVLTVTASEHRSQWRNRLVAEQRLAAVLREATRPPSRPRRATKPTKGSQRRRLDAKRRRGEIKRLRRRSDEV
ncbi:MAG TPA: alternative ribosome rescue aminoacyl-tRNA hydrolase ArfB [Nocardioidaceae bacterium]|nr:alternative ribosome rescue aminoacyl-tRNA hydrolase ArfB [Nocardioidaceae bacterium]